MLSNYPGCVEQPIQFQIGDSQESTPANGASLWSEQKLKGKNFTFEKAGIGTWLEGVHWSRYHAGGVQLMGSAVFSTGEFYTSIIYN